MALNCWSLEGEWQPGTKRAVKRYTARKRRRLWRQRGEHAPRKTRELTKGWST